MPISDKEIHWYVFSVSFRKEIEIRDELLSLGFGAYVPMHFHLQNIRGRKLRKKEPSVYGLVFAYGTRRDLLQYRETSKVKDYMYLKSIRHKDNSLEYIYVRDCEMENFIKLNNVSGAELTYYKPEEIRLAKGEKVKIMDGPFEGIVGIIQKLPHKRGQYLVVSLPNVAIAAVSIKPEYIEPVTHKIAKSVDVEKDCKLLYQQSLKLIANKDLPNRELVLDEINQLKESLEGCKVFLPNDKANYYFAHYVAALVVKDYKTASHNKALFQEILPKLKANNLLIPLSHQLFYYETKDNNELQKAEDIIKKWDRSKYSEPQRQILKLQHLLVHGLTDDANNMQK